MSRRYEHDDGGNSDSAHLRLGDCQLAAQVCNLLGRALQVGLYSAHAGVDLVLLDLGGRRFRILVWGICVNGVMAHTVGSHTTESPTPPSLVDARTCTS